MVMVEKRSKQFRELISSCQEYLDMGEGLTYNCTHKKEWWIRICLR